MEAEVEVDWHFGVEVEVKIPLAPALTHTTRPSAPQMPSPVT